MRRIILIFEFIIFIYILSASNTLYFDGYSNKIIVSEQESDFPGLFTDLDNNSFTIDFWIKIDPDTPNATRIIDIKHSSEEFVSIIYYNQKICCSVKNPSNIASKLSTTDNISADLWYYVILKWDAGERNAVLKLNGEVQSGSCPDISSGNENYFYIGTKTNSGTYFKGEIDEFRIWDSASVNWQVKDAFTDRVTGLESNLYLYYAMEEFYQTDLMEDGSNNNFHGDCSSFNTSSFIEMTAWQNGYRCLYFDGVNDYVTIQDCPFLNTTSMTLILWFQTGNLSSDQYLFSKGDNGYYLKIGSDQQFVLNGFYTSEVTLDTDRWYSIAVSYGQSDSKLYLDGSELNLSGSSNNYFNSDPLFIGKRSNDLFSGKIDEVQLYDTSLTDQQIAQLIYSNFIEYPELTAWLDFNSLEGNIVYDRCGNLLASLNGLEEGISTAISNNWIREVGKDWLDSYFNGLYVTILDQNFFQDRLIEITANGNQVTVTEDWSPMLTGENDYSYCISDAERIVSDLIFPDELPENNTVSPFIISTNHPKAHSNGLTIESAVIGSGNSLQGGSNGLEGTTADDLDAGSIDYRLARIWYIYSEGSVTGLSLNFDLGQICGQEIILGNINYYKLLFRTGVREPFSEVTGDINVQMPDENTISFTGSSLDSPEGYFTIGAINNTPLPVTLSLFTGTWSGSGCVLNWETRSEVNNSGWNIYRGEDNYQQLKINPAIIPGAGTTTNSMHYVFEDQYETGPGIYYYWLESITLLGWTEMYGPVTIAVPDESEQESPPVPKIYGIISYPNPFNPISRISLNIPQSGYYDLCIYNIKGQMVKELFGHKFLENDKEFYLNWDGRNSNGRKSSAGDYFLLLKGENYCYYKKITLLS